MGTGQRLPPRPQTTAAGAAAPTARAVEVASALQPRGSRKPGSEPSSAAAGAQAECPVFSKCPDARWCALRRLGRSVPAVVGRS